MKNHSPQSQYIEDHVKLETVMGWYAPLTVNHNGKALIHCPFHADKHPSMHVNTNKGKWACYVCNKGGDAISFVMEKENCTFPEALNLICSRHGGPAAGYNKPAASNGKPVANSKSQTNSSPAITVNTGGSSPENNAGCTAKCITGCTEDITPDNNGDGTANNCLEDEGFFAPLGSSTQPGQSSETTQPKAPEATPAQLQAMVDENVSFTKTWYGYEPDCPELCQAYVDFGGQSALPLIEKYDNLLVVQTFSKSRSMAGMRIGFACGNEKLIRFLNDVKYSFNSYTMDRTAIAAGVAAVEDKAYFDETCNKIIETREWTKKELKALGFSFQDSMSNFIFATHKTCPAKELFEALRGQHIYVRYFQEDRIDNFLRITVGTKEEMQKFIDFLKDYLK